MSNKDAPHKLLTHNGFTWAYDEPGCHFYSKKLDNGKYELMRLLPTDLGNGNFEFMADHGLTNTNKAPRAKVAA